MKTKIIMAAAMTVLLSACMSQPAQTLDQRLATAATAKEKAEIKRLICLKEAEYVNGKHYPVKAPSRGHSVPATPKEVYEAKERCR